MGVAAKKFSLLVLALGVFADEYGMYDEDMYNPAYDDGGMGGMMDDEYGGGDPTPASEEIMTVEGVAEFVAAEMTEPSVIGFFEEDSDALESFQSVAESNRYDFRFAYVTDADVRTHFKYKTSVVLVYPPPRFVSDKYDKPRARYPGSKIDSEALTKFMYKKSLPLVAQKTWKSGDRYDKANLPILTLFAAVDLEKNPKGFDYFANRLRKVAVDYVGKVVFNIGDKEDFSYALQDYDLDLPTKKDVGVGVKDGNKHYKMETKFNVENLKAFVESVLSGELVPKIKEVTYHDEDGDDEDSGGGDYEESDVAVLTSDNFEETVDGKDAMIEFYAPWCGHCQALKPAYKQLASKFSDTPSVVVGAMDATAHEPPAAYEVSGYPTIYFKDQTGKISSYDGDRNLDSMVEYIQNHAADPMSKAEL